MAQDLPLSDDARALAEALPSASPALLERARAQASQRVIDYPFGSGHADEAALAAGIKPVIRQLLEAGEIEAARARFTARGFAVEVAPFTHFYPTRRALFAGRDARRVAAAAEHELLEDADLAMGELLGYPRCCVEAYLALPPPRPNAPVLRAALSRTEGRAHPRLNTLDLAVFHFISFFPCSFRCERAVTLASALASALRPGHARFVQAVEEALSAHRLYALEDVQVSIRGRFDGQRVWVERAWPTCRDRHPNAPSSAEEREAAARLAALISEAGSVAVDEERIVVGERAIARTKAAMLVPFGPSA
jgi:hypothetical protein